MIINMTRSRRTITSTCGRSSSPSISGRTAFRVKQIQTTIDYYVYTSDDAVVEGVIEAGKVYEEADFNRSIEIREREKKRVEVFLSQINQNEKTLVFCANQAHALLVRDLINQLKTSKDPNYCHRVTANAGVMRFTRPASTVPAPSSCAAVTPRILSATCAAGCARVAPPTVPTASGSSRRP